VEILRIEAANPSSPDKAKQKERITLSLRARQEDPWQLAASQLRDGEKVTGKVVRLQPFGAFVEVMPGVDGLIHVSALSNRRVAHPKDVVQVGQEVQAVVEKIDPVEKRLSLRLWREGEENEAPSESGEGRAERSGGGEGKPREERAPRPQAGQTVKGTVDRIESYGVFLKIPGGRGLIPASETGTDRGTDLRKQFKLGAELTAFVLEVDPQGKIRLSLTAAERAAERAEVEAWTQSQKPKGGGKKGLGTLADLLKGVKLK
jgi:small subunit ribosomal protein S1